MTTEAEKAYKVWLAEQQVAGCWFDPELLKSSFVHGYESTFSAGHASRDGEVAKLEAEVKELETKAKTLDEIRAQAKDIAAKMVSLDPEYAQIVSDHFWELLA